MNESTNYVLLTDNTKYISGAVTNVEKVKIWVRSHSDTITGNVVLKLVDETGVQSQTSEVIAVTTDYVMHELSCEMTGRLSLGIYRDSSDVLDTLADGGAVVSLRVSTPCEVA